MNKHFLVTISNDVEYLFGPRFICSFFQQMSEHHLTLLHICRKDSEDISTALNEMWSSPDEKVTGNLTVGARRSIDKAQLMLAKSKMSIDQVIIKTVAERYGKVKDILTEAASGLYDAIILGRRASYTLQWVFERPADEIAQYMIKDNCCSTPIWICPETEPERKNVLLCVDGSENGYRAVDHAGYILSLQTQHQITLLHITNGNTSDTDGIFQRAESLLREHGIGGDRIRRHVTWGLSVSGTIQSEAEKGGYAAIALGLHGQAHNLKKDLILAGGTTSKLINRLQKTALWCCP